MTAGFAILSAFVCFMYIVNINQFICLTVHDKKISRPCWLLGGAAVLLTLADPFFSLDQLLEISGVALTYILIFLLILITHSKHKFRSLYIAVLYFALDSAISASCLLVKKAIGISGGSDMSIKLIVLVLCIIAHVFIQYLKTTRRDEIREIVKILPRKVYALLMLYIFMLGILCSFIAAAPAQDSAYFSAFSVMFVITVFLSLLVTLNTLINSASRYYFENMSALLNDQIEIQLNHYIEADKYANDIRAFRHDYKNHMICLQDLISSHSDEDALEYLSSIIENSAANEVLTTSGNKTADAIIRYKKNIAEQNHCEIRFSGVISDSISPYQICTILSNALDNSIEACQKLGSQHSDISINCTLVNNIQLIVIKNPAIAEKYKGQTSKSDKVNHGFGLYNIQRAVSMLDGRMSIPQRYPDFILEIEFQIPVAEK